MKWAMLLLLWLAACQATADDLRGLAAGPALDYAVLVTGGAFRVAASPAGATFAPPQETAAAADEPIAMHEVVALLRHAAVFQRVGEEDGSSDRLARRDQLRAGASSESARNFLEAARGAGYDLVLCVEELADGPVEARGVNGRWPLTFATWILLGIGVFIPDHTFESRATLRVTLRELDTGKILHDPLLLGGPVELSLAERGDVLGLLTSVLVPPFLVGDDEAAVARALREVLRQRLLLSLVRDLKSESVRQRLRERSLAALTREAVSDQDGLRVDASESITSVRLRPTDGSELDPAEQLAFTQTLLASRRLDGERLRYAAPLPVGLRGRGLQVLVATLRGGVASATFAGLTP